MTDKQKNEELLQKIVMPFQNAQGHVLNVLDGIHGPIDGKQYVLLMEAYNSMAEAMNKIRAALPTK